MIGKVFTKQICCGIASALGFSGSVYFVVKQTAPADPITTITIAPPTAKSDNSIDLTDPISKAADIGIGDIDVMFEILNRMQKNGIVPTIQQLIEHKDKWAILAELMKDCFPEKNGTNVVASTKPECKVPDEKEDKEKFLKMFLQFGDKIKELMEQNKKDIQANKTNLQAAEPLTVAKAVEQLVMGQKFSESKEKNTQTHAFLGDLKTLLNDKKTKGETVDEGVMQQIESLISFYSPAVTKDIVDT